MQLPKVLRLTPPGDKALRIVEQRVKYLRDGGLIPMPRHGTVDDAITLNLASMEAQAIALPRGPELEDLMDTIQSLKADLVDDQSGWLVWLWISDNARQLACVDRFVQ